jgi:hypothetical protein
MEGNPPALVPASSLESVGYAEEFLVEGTARSFTLTGERAADGRWSVKEDATAPYVTRILVRRPVDPARFSGTVAVEWNNVSAGMDVSPDWSLLQRELVQCGHIWVGVSVAGTSHVDTYSLFASAQDDGRLAPAAFAELMKPTTAVLFATTDSPVNAGPQQHYIGQAALDALVAWAAGGPVPPQAHRLELDTGGQLALGEHGIARGGIRTPWVDVPTATLSGLGQGGEGFAVLAGRTDPFDRQTLERLYPGGRPDYLNLFANSLDATIEAGFLRPEDRAEILALAEASYVSAEESGSSA